MIINSLIICTQCTIKVSIANFRIRLIFYRTYRLMNTRWIANTASSQPPDREKHFAVFQSVSCVDLFYLDMTEAINIKTVHQLCNMNGTENFLPYHVPFSLLSKLCVVVVSNKKGILLSCLITCILHLPSSRRKHIHERRSIKQLVMNNCSTTRIFS